MKHNMKSHSEENTEEHLEDSLEKHHHESRTKLKKMLILSLVLSIPIFIIAMPFMWLGIEVPYKNVVLLILATPVQFIAGYGFYKGTFNALRTRMANMDMLIAIGTSAAYFYSLAIVVMPSLGMEVYFETSALLITFILIGRLMEATAKGKVSSAIKKLIGLQPKTAIVVRNGKELSISVNDVLVGDVVLVKPGQRIPVDSVVMDGSTSVDESMITGESIPIEKKKGDTVIGATINKHGSLRVRATRIGSDTALSQIIRLVEDAQGSKTPLQRIADRVSAVFIPVVLVIAFAAAMFWFFVMGQSFAFSLSIFIAVLIISCPCSLGLATPTAIMIGTSKGAENGILVKDAAALETIRNVTTFVFDKTGTLTNGRPVVTNVLPEKDRKIILHYAAIAERNSEHPLADAILKAFHGRVPNPSSFVAIPGHGIRAKYNGKTILLGNRRLMRGLNIRPVVDDIDRLESEGKTVMLVAVNKRVLGIIAVADTMKDSSVEAISKLKEKNIDVIMITGDNEKTAKAIAGQIGIEHVLADVLPADKEKEVAKLQKRGEVVAMVGDGINDAPALARADVGIAIGAGTDIAMETGQIILVRNDLRDVLAAINLSNYTVRKIKQNLFWAFFYNSVGIPIAAGILYPFTGFLLNPIVAGAAMALSSVSVVSNSLLMRGYKKKY